MREEGLAKLHVLFLEVVILGREAESALEGVERVDVAPLLVGADGDGEQASDALIVEHGERVGQVGQVADGVDLREVGGDGLGARGVDRHGIHGGGEEIADLLLDRAGLVRLGGGGLEDGLEAGLVVFIQLRESAPAGLVGGDRVVLGPVAPGVAGEVGARVHGGVHVTGAETRDGRQVGGRQRGGQADRGEDKAEVFHRGIRSAR